MNQFIHFNADLYANLYLLLCLQVFIISVLSFKRLSPLYFAISYFSFKLKRQRLLLGL